MTDNMINLNLNDYAKKGLYLILKDSSRLEMTDDLIKEITKKYWEDPTKILLEVKKAIDFQRCPFCPRLKDGGICDAIRPVLPFLEIIDRYVSFDEVTAIYKGHRKELLRLSDTTMQNALVYLSTLSLIHYCQAAIKYRKYFYGVNPMMGAKETSARIYLNIFWEKSGDRGQVNKILSEFKATLSVTIKNQVKRLGLISKNDAFLNAIANTQIITELLTLNFDNSLEKSFKNIELESQSYEPFYG